MEDPELHEVPFWVTFSSFPVEYLSWSAVRGIANMVGKVDNRTLPFDHARRNLGFNVKILFDTRQPLPAGVKEMLANDKDSFVRFIYEHLPNNFHLFCFTIKHSTENCAGRDDHQQRNEEDGIPNSGTSETETQRILNLPHIANALPKNHNAILSPGIIYGAQLVVDSQTPHDINKSIHGASSDPAPLRNQNCPSNNLNNTPSPHIISASVAPMHNFPLQFIPNVPPIKQRLSF